MLMKMGTTLLGVVSVRLAVINYEPDDGVKSNNDIILDPNDVEPFQQQTLLTTMKEAKPFPYMDS